MRSINLNNSIWSITDVLLYPVLYLFFTPFFIKQLGEEVYGTWMIVNTLIVFMQIFNFGLGLNTQRSVAIAVGENNIAMASQIVIDNVSIAIIISFLCIVFGLVFAQFQFFFDIFHLPDSIQRTTFLSISISGIIVGLKFIEQILTNTLVAFERIALVSRYNILVRILVLFVSILLIFGQFPIFFIFLFTAITYFCAIFILLQFVQQYTNKFNFKFSFSKSTFLKEFQYSKWIWLQSVCVIVAFQFDKLLIAHWIGVKDFSYYSIVSTIFNHLHLALMAVAPWALPQIAKKFANAESYNTYYYSMRSLIHIICYIGICILYLLYDKLFTLWLGNTLFSQIALSLRMYMAFQLIFMFTIAPFFLLNAIGKSKLATINTFIYSILSLLGIVVGFYVGHSISSILFGLIIAISIAMVIQQIMLSKALHFNIIGETLGLLTPMATLSCFILMKGYPIVYQSIMIITSLLLFIYVYFVKYPVRLQSLGSSSLPPKGI